jgi:hypothetical protein
MMTMITNDTHAHACAHTHTHQCEHEDLTVLCNQGIHTDGEVSANRPVQLLKTKKRKHAY